MNASTQPLIEFQHVHKRYLSEDGDEVHALDDVHFNVAPKSFVCVVGPSGCGKSTLLRILAGLLNKSDGTVLLGGQPLEGPKRDVGVVFQDSVLLPWLTVLENVLVPARVQKLDPGRSARRAVDLLDLVGGLTRFKDKYPNELSGGMRQRVAIARALLHDPQLLLMDEPFGALDALTREQMTLELMRIWAESGKTVLFITHSVNEAVFLGDRVIVMSPRPGRIVDDVNIALPRPRSFDLMVTDDFGGYAARVRGRLGANGFVD